MRAVIIAIAKSTGGDALAARHPTPMLPLIDRPFVQHVVEFLAEQGVREFDFVLSHLPEVIEGHLGDGARWGCRFTYHLARIPNRPYGVLGRLRLDLHSDEQLLLGHADRLPIAPLASLKEAAGRERRPVLLVSPEFRDNGVGTERTDWGLLTARQLRTIPPGMCETDLSEYLQSAFPDTVLVPVETLLRVRTPEELLAAQQVVLRKQVDGLLLSPREKSVGLWVSSRAKVSALAELSPPLYIGPNCLIGPGAHLGPHTAVGAGCIVDGPCHISNTTILPDSFVGAGMILDRAVMDRDLVVHSGNNSATVISDALILGSVSKISLSHIVSELLPRLLALALLIVLLPLLLLTVLGLLLLRRGRVLCSHAVVRLPVLHAGSPWPTYRLYKFVPNSKGSRLPRWLVAVVNFLPGLINVMRGEICFVGLMPRMPEEIKELPEDWRDLYLHTKGGLLSMTDLLGEDQTIEDEFAADAAYATGQSWRRDLRVLAAYLLRALQEPLKWLLLPITSRADTAADGMASWQHVCDPENVRGAEPGNRALPQFVLREATPEATHPFSPRRGDNGHFNSRPPHVASSE